MASPLEIGRVAFQRPDALDDPGRGDEVPPVSPVSSVVDLHAHQVRAIYSPPGHALGRITLTTAMTKDGVVTAIPIALEDTDEGATMLRFDADWPLMWTTITVEHARDEPFELFFVYEHRG